MRYTAALLLYFRTLAAVCFLRASSAHLSEQYTLRPLTGKGFPQFWQRFVGIACKAASSSGSLGRTASRKYRHMALFV